MNNPLALKSGDVFPHQPMSSRAVLMTQTIPEEVQKWLERFEVEQWSGSITFHFNRGQLSSYEPKPNLRTIAK